MIVEHLSTTEAFVRVQDFGELKIFRRQTPLRNLLSARLSVSCSHSSCIEIRSWSWCTFFIYPSCQRLSPWKNISAHCASDMESGNRIRISKVLQIDLMNIELRVVKGFKSALPMEESSGRNCIHKNKDFPFLTFLRNFAKGFRGPRLNVNRFLTWLMRIIIYGQKKSMLTNMWARLNVRRMQINESALYASLYFWSRSFSLLLCPKSERTIVSPQQYRKSNAHLFDRKCVADSAKKKHVKEFFPSAVPSVLFFPRVSPSSSLFFPCLLYNLYNFFLYFNIVNTHARTPNNNFFSANVRVIRFERTRGAWQLNIERLLPCVRTCHSSFGRPNREVKFLDGRRSAVRRELPARGPSVSAGKRLYGDFVRGASIFL